MKKIIKKIIPVSFLNFLRSILLNHKRKLIKNLKFIKKENVIYMGTDYGGWSLLKNDNLKNKYIISAGLGEDASFDIEIISKYNCKVIAVDPTPRAIDHYNEIIKNCGNFKTEEYREDGKLNIKSYDLTKINNNNFILIKKALYNNNHDLNFYAPINKSHVSFSLNNWQNGYSDKSEYIKVKTITVKNIIDKFKIENLEILKLDIEGAEIEVIKNILDQRILPNQILVEFDELNLKNKLAMDRFNEIHERLLSENYELIEGSKKFANFLYAK